MLPIRLLLRTAFLFSAIAPPWSVLARDSVLQSAPVKVHLLELFTSEGCSSCPPAEARFSKLKTDPRLWKDFVPVAFHVDYWDKLGWPDRFSAKAWTDRQRAYAANWNATTVYTPQFVLDGRDWHGEQIPAASAERAGILKVTLVDGSTAVISFKSETPRASGFDIYVAALGFGLNSDVKAGENRGRKLQHDFVVLSLAKKAMSGADADVDVRVPVELLKQHPNEVGAMAVWITEAGGSVPLQATGGWLR